MKSLKARADQLSQSKTQIAKLAELTSKSIPFFADRLKEIGLFPLKPIGMDILQLNVGKMCNQTCAHCHVDAGPDRKEIMTRETMEYCLKAIDRLGVKTLDLTGGAPEMNPHFRWFVSEARSRGAKIIVRCNLTIILANAKYHDLPDFFKTHQVEVVSSLPHYTSVKTDSQRGQGVFAKSIEALKMLNAVGYGKEGSGLALNLVYNPAGAFLPGEQMALERDFKAKLKKDFNIDFNSLYCITNMPISRFLDYLLKSDNLQGYMETLANAFNPTAAAGVMCRNLISVGWDGKLYDCDFNQMLEMELPKAISHISQLAEASLEQVVARDIAIHQHCYGCTAGSGSSCGGTTTAAAK